MRDPQSGGRNSSRELEQAQQACARSAWIARASEMLAVHENDERALLRAIASIAVPEVADVAIVDEIDRADESVVRHVAAPLDLDGVSEWGRDATVAPDAEQRGSARGLADGVPDWVQSFANEVSPPSLPPRTHSTVSAPLRCEGETIGAITWVRIEDRGRSVAEKCGCSGDPRPYSADDLMLLMDFAQRAGAAVASTRRARWLAHGNGALRLSRERYRGAWVALRGMVYERELATGRITFARGLTTLLGYDESDVSGDLAEWWRSKVHPDDAPELALAGSLLSGAERLEHTYRIRHADGHLRHVVDRSTTLRRGLAMGCVIDISQPVEQGLRWKQKSEEDEELIATLCHELRNPLGAAHTALYLLEREIESATPGRVSRERAILRRQLEHMTRLVNDLIEGARLVRGQGSFLETGLDLRELVKEIAVDHAPVLRRAGRRFRVRTGGERISIWGDRARLVQVIANVLQNAIKFTAEQGLIELSLERHGETARLIVRDDGAGVSPEKLQAIFDPFMQVERRRGGGLGLGLALVRAIVERHHGRVHAESGGVGRGTAVVIELPLRADDLDDSQARILPPPAMSGDHP